MLSDAWAVSVSLSCELELGWELGWGRTQLMLAKKKGTTVSQV